MSIIDYLSAFETNVPNHESLSYRQPYQEVTYSIRSLVLNKKYHFKSEDEWFRFLQFYNLLMPRHITYDLSIYPKMYRPIFFDFDFSFPHNIATIPSDIVKRSTILCDRAIREVIDSDVYGRYVIDEFIVSQKPVKTEIDNNMTSIISDRRYPYRRYYKSTGKQVVKDGFHVYYPNLFVSVFIHNKIRSRIMHYMHKTRIYEQLPSSDKLDDIVDGHPINLGGCLLLTGTVKEARHESPQKKSHPEAKRFTYYTTPDISDLRPFKELGLSNPYKTTSILYFGDVVNRVN